MHNYISLSYRLIFPFVNTRTVDYCYNFCNVPFYSRTRINYCSGIVINGRMAVAITPSNSGDNLN